MLVYQRVKIDIYHPWYADSICRGATYRGVEEISVPTVLPAWAWIPDDPMICHWYPLVNIQKAMEMAIEIVGFPINSMVMFHSYVNVYQRVNIAITRGIYIGIY